MRATNTGDDYKLYYLDEGQETWVDKGDFEVKQTSTESTNESVYQNILSNEEIENLILINLNKVAPLPTQPKKPLKADNQKFKFTLEYEAEEFPELTAYDGLTFELEEGQGFMPAYYDIVYDKIELKRISRSSKYEIILRKGKNKKVFKSYPVLEGIKYENAQAIFDKLDLKYKTALNKRKEEEKRLRAAAIQKRKDKKAELANATENRKEEYKAYLASLNKTQRTYMSAMNVFSIKKMGIWNCDRKREYPKGQRLIAQFSDAFGEKLAPYKVFLIQEGSNAIFTFTPNDFNKIELGINYHNFKLTTYDMETVGREGADKLLSFDENS